MILPPYLESDTSLNVEGRGGLPVEEPIYFYFINENYAFSLLMFFLLYCSILL
jgi:hypothetical protein